MPRSKHENVRLKPVSILRVRSSVFVGSDGRRHSYLDLGAWRFRCSIGRSGVTRDKREGDGKTPVGRFAILGWRFRPAGLVGARPVSAWRLIRPDDGWCDQPGAAAYNRPVRLPVAAGHEKMWRDDIKYDAVGILDYNIFPRRSLRGSAIFFHLCSAEFEITAGCIAIPARDMQKLLPRLAGKTFLVV